MQSYGSLLDALIGLSWPARRPVGTGTAGSHPSRLRGMTAEFTEYRLYRQGDDPRRLDWKLLARTDRAYLRITDDHAIRTTLLLLDGSASLAFPLESMAKWTQATRLAIGLATVARAEGDPIGLVISRNEGLLRIPARSRRDVIGEIVRAVEGVKPSGTTGLAPALDGVQRHSRVVIISDFLGDEPELRARAARLVVEGVEVFAIHIVADEELELASSARLAVDPEDAGVQRVLQREVAAEYAARFSAWRSSVAERWRLAGAEYTEVRTGDDAASAIRRIVHGP